MAAVHLGAGIAVVAGCPVVRGGVQATYRRALVAGAGILIRAVCISLAIGGVQIASGKVEPSTVQGEECVVAGQAHDRVDLIETVGRLASPSKPEPMAQGGQSCHVQERM